VIVAVLKLRPRLFKVESLKKKEIKIEDMRPLIV